MSYCDKAVFRAENVTREDWSPTCDKAVLFLVPEVWQRVQQEEQPGPTRGQTRVHN